jgi:hypothetical protein
MKTLDTLSMKNSYLTTLLALLTLGSASLSAPMTGLCLA